MPRRRMYNRKKRSRRRRQYTLAKKQGPGFSPSYPIGKTFRFKTRYVETAVNLNPGLGGVPISHVYCLNGLYDPNVTGVGHQPVGFDQLMPLYDHYCVIAARARVTAFNSDATNATKIILQIKDSPTVSTDAISMLENGQNRWVTLAPRGSGGNVKTLTINCSPKKFFGRSVMADDKYMGTITSNPTDKVYLHVVNAPETGADVELTKFSIIIEYIAILTEPKQLSQS